MAETSGIIQTNALEGTYFWVKWSVKTQGLVNNNPVTTINWSCGVYTAHNYYLNAIKMSAFTINGTQVYGGGTYSNFSRLTNNTLAYGELSIPHDSDGTKSFNISSFEGEIYDTGKPSASGKSFTLPSIAVKAIITSAPDFNDNSNPTISYNNAAGSSVHELHACISITGATDDVVYREVSKTGNSYTFNLTEAERNTLRNATTGNPPSRNVLFIVRTRMTPTSEYSNSAEERTFTVIPSDATNPTDTISVSPVGNLPSAFTGLYVQGRVKASVTHSATFKNGATAASYTTAVDGRTYSGASVTTDYINTAGSVTITGTVRDSRGFTASDSKTIEVLPYAKPAVAQIPGLQEIVCARCDEDGNLSASGTYLKVRCSRRYSTVTSGGVQKNFCLLRLRVNSGSWKTLITRTAAGDTYDGVVPGVTLNVDSVYTIQIEAVDDIGEVHDIYFDIPTEEVPLHLGEGGLNIGVGRYANMESSERVDVAWDTYFEKNLSVDGDTDVSGDMNVDGNVDVGGLSIGGVAVDYIVEQGKSGIWTYEKWNSGKAKCWGILSGQIASAAEILQSSYPFSFTAIENVHATGAWNDFSGSSYCAVIPTREQSRVVLRFYELRGGSVSGTVGASVYAIGRWK